MRAKHLILLSVIGIALGVAPAAKAAPSSVTDAALSPAQQREAKAIGGQVNCLCGCLTTVNRCPHLHCSMKAQEKSFIAADIKAGKPPRTVIQDLVLHYGVKILPAPPPRGFNLTAWMLPGFGLIVGLVVAVDLARRWRRHPAATDGTNPVPLDPKILAAIEEERKSVE